MGGEEGPRSAAHVEGGPVVSGAGGICGHSATGNRQLAGACSTLGREAPRLAGVSRAPGVGSVQAPAPMEGVLPETGCRRVSVHTHPGWGLAWPSRPCVLGRVSQGLFAGSHAPSSSFSCLTPRNLACQLGGQNWVCGVPLPLQSPRSRSGGRRCGCSPQACLPGGARVPLRLGGDRPASQPPWGRRCRSLPSGVQPRLSVRLLG